MYEHDFCMSSFLLTSGHASNIDDCMVGQIRQARSYQSSTCMDMH